MSAADYQTKPKHTRKGASLRPPTFEEVIAFCNYHRYRLVDDEYKPQLWRTFTGDSGHRAISETVYMCTCGWASKRHPCPHHSHKRAKPQP